MARFLYQGTAKDQMGKVLDAASVAVYLAGSTTAATIYALETGAADADSIVASDSTGFFSFWIDEADYNYGQRFKIIISKTSFESKTYDNIDIFPRIFGGTPQTLTDAGAVSVITKTTWVVTTGAVAITLADGTEGQEKFIVVKTYVGDATLTPTNFTDGTTLTFTAVNQVAHLIFTDSGWKVIYTNGTVA